MWSQKIIHENKLKHQKKKEKRKQKGNATFPFGGFFLTSEILYITHYKFWTVEPTAWLGCMENPLPHSLYCNEHIWLIVITLKHLQQCFHFLPQCQLNEVKLPGTQWGKKGSAISSSELVLFTNLLGRCWIIIMPFL